MPWALNGGNPALRACDRTLRVTSRVTVVAHVVVSRSGDGAVSHGSHPGGGRFRQSRWHEDRGLRSHPGCSMYRPQRLCYTQVFGQRLMRRSDRVSGRDSSLRLVRNGRDVQKLQGAVGDPRK